MKKDTAARIMREMLDLGDHLNAATELVEGIDAEAERKRFRRAVGNLMGLIHTDVMIPIIREYPDLDPDRPDPDRSGESDS